MALGLQFLSPREELMKLMTSILTYASLLTAMAWGSANAHAQIPNPIPGVDFAVVDIVYDSATNHYKVAYTNKGNASPSQSTVGLKFWANVQSYVYNVPVPAPGQVLYYSVYNGGFGTT